VTGHIEVLFDFLFEVLFAEGFGKYDLADLVTADIGRQTGQTLFAGAPDPHQKSGRASLFDDAADAHQVA